MGYYKVMRSGRWLYFESPSDVLAKRYADEVYGKEPVPVVEAEYNLARFNKEFDRYATIPKALKVSQSKRDAKFFQRLHQ